ncbi:MAG: transcriptional repressor [Victivallaceae bacterium]|nr:transcriptional repressor [Victivallaceae bacterium]
MENASTFRTLCRENGWKCTPQRLAVYEYVCTLPDHPSVDEVRDAVRKTIPTITRESVYRILNEFSGAGILYRMDQIDNAHYDADAAPHGHLVCEKCGAVVDFPLKRMPEIPDCVEKKHVRHIEVRMTWICPRCAGKKDGDL